MKIHNMCMPISNLYKRYDLWHYNVLHDTFVSYNTPMLFITQLFFTTIIIYLLQFNSSVLAIRNAISPWYSLLINKAIKSSDNRDHLVSCTTGLRSERRSAWIRWSLYSLRKVTSNTGHLRVWKGTNYIVFA